MTRKVLKGRMFVWRQFEQKKVLSELGSSIGLRVGYRGETSLTMTLIYSTIFSIATPMPANLPEGSLLV